MAAVNWFATGGDAYARYRPDYPDELAAFLARAAPSTALAVDVGCGSGQLTRRLAAHFDAVVGVDPSAAQIASAVAGDHVRYVQASAEATGLPDGSATLIAAGQAAHWFDLPAFYGEVRRIAMPGALLALVSYGVPVFDAVLDPRFRRFYWDEISNYWPPERRLVESGYATIDFPFVERPWPAMDIRRDWDLAAFFGYVSTWSATRRLEQAGREDLLDAFAHDIAALWGDPETRRPVRWPIAMRLGVVGD